ncbi:hypothetical protein TVAG_074620 [Trichomonas vaginalis G3]|uniref:Cullin family profile domain-containing protein n=1 Tax=Trichomonas vaginalis (strain ATCC PRA-98 / G3) TaxID=412133 RepID=A2E3X9_TRIV3|nr:Cullin homology domain family [Trichomonas vaginalis G3]EAY12634.1 hypothetical protein TVAG_074620 [Trichomonas vaginalis G3]KAI5546995.1 Cullin homology domain family [Trichomonas vaginalis G3]|eukprot:XP_001324857.1 hypothetical protein [Trichomonas vaginalis G3]
MDILQQKQNDLLYNILDCISQQKRPPCSFSAAYTLVFNFSRSINFLNFITIVSEAVKNNISSIISSVMSMNIRDFERYLLIFQKYNFYYRNVTAILGISEEYSTVKEYSVHDILKTTFIKLMKENISIQSFVKVLDEEIELFREERDYKQYKQLDKIKQPAVLIDLVYANDFDDLIIELQKCWEIFSEKFISISNEEFIKDLYFILEREKWMLQYLFSMRYHNIIMRKIYEIIIHSENFENSLKVMSQSLNNRDTDVFDTIYNSINIIPVSNDAIGMFNEAVSVSFEKENSELNEMIKTLEFYSKLFDNLNPKNEIVYNTFMNVSTNYVNRDSYAVLNQVSKLLNQKVTKNEPFDELNGILYRMRCKSELELYHSRIVTKRLLPPSLQTIERESNVIKKLHQISPLFQFRDLQIILRESRASLELNAMLDISPSLFIPSAVWPYKPPYYLPVHLSVFVDQIRAKYLQMFPRKQLEFPIISWLVTLKDTVRNSTIIGNGIHAEALIEVSEKKKVTKQSLQPHIPDNVLVVALEGLSTNKAPILVKDEEDNYTIGIQKLPGTIRLQNFSFVANKQATDVPKHDTINCKITRILKDKRAMSIPALTTQVINELSSFFIPTESEVNHSLQTLVERDFVKIKDNIAYYLP